MGGLRTRDSAMAGLKLLDHCAVLGLADEVAGDEAGGAVHLVWAAKREGVRDQHLKG